MIVYPAVDLRGGRAVQLVGGVPGSDRVSLPDPERVAKHWIESGFRALHVVDLDAALGTGSNHAIIGRLIRDSGVPVQVGGGVRDEDAVAGWIAAGAARVITGTRAVEDPEWLAAVATRFRGRIVVAADIRDGSIVTHGWVNETARPVEEFVDTLEALPLAGVLVTDVGREGRLQGIDAQRFRDIAVRTRHPLIAAGGIACIDDLRALDDAGVAGAVLGMSLYTGAVDAAAAAREFQT